MREKRKNQIEDLQPLTYPQLDLAIAASRDQSEIVYLLTNKLKAYQKENVKNIKALWNQGFDGAILADEMGLGKTIQFCELILQALDSKPGHILLVATPSTSKQTKQALREALIEAALLQFQIKTNQIKGQAEAEKLYNQLIKYRQFIDNYLLGNFNSKNGLNHKISVNMRKLNEGKGDSKHLQNKINFQNKKLAQANEWLNRLHACIRLIKKQYNGLVI